MGATNFTPTPTILDPTEVVTHPVDGDTINRDNLYLEAAPGATPKITHTLLLNYLAAQFKPTVSNRGALAADETLTLGSMEYRYDEPTADRIITLPDGTYEQQEIVVRGSLKNPTFKIEFQHAASTTVPIKFLAGATVLRPWARLRWSFLSLGGATADPQWHVAEYGGGATLP